MLSYITWDFDPELFNLFGAREVRWYGLCWGIGIYCAFLIVQKIYKSEKLPEKWFESLFYYVVIGVIIGARLGHCLFYDPISYLSHPVEILKVWEGGLSSHGGVIGIIVAVWLYSRKITKKSMLWTFDRLIVGACITATFIRIGNLLNSEIFGRPTGLPWAMRFLRSREYHELVPNLDMGCHPTQLYEALVYFVLFGVALWLFWKTKAKEKQGLILGICITGIFLSRFLIEILKNVQEPFELQMRASYGIDMGQLLSVPFVIWGVWLIFNSFRVQGSK
ncbi:prolipoprotein diacylglyceryl transferase [Viscerimonas tarda]